MKSSIPAVILCGGQSSRMGRPKHLIKLSDSYIWKKIYDQLSEGFDKVYVSCRANQLEDFGSVETILDEYTSIGPMGGIQSSMQFLKSESIHFVACDIPNYSAEIGLRLLSKNDPLMMATCAIARNAKFPEPTIAIWNRTAEEQLARAISYGDYSLMRLLQSHDYNTVEFPSELLINLNHQSDLDRIKE